ncbi:MAG: hypothetical protein ACRD8U_06190 [Pyrinomonadaceae bacterium]
MDTLDATKWRVRSIRTTIANLSEGEFPYKAPLQALQILDEYFETEHQAFLSHLGEDSERATVMRRCAEAIRDVSVCLPLLAFMLRATNVRNAFEIHAPLQRIAKQLLGEQTQLVLSSEWEYSPFTYTKIDYLPDFVLIGFPAIESDNPLILPLAGHELGHTLWGQLDLHSTYLTQIKGAIINKITTDWAKYSIYFPSLTKEQSYTDIVAYTTWSEAIEWALRQVEEVFCDVVGLRIFGGAYLEAFSFLVAPRLGQERTALYPSLRDRVEYMCSAAEKWSIEIPSKYRERFEFAPAISPDEAWRFRLELADFACNEQVDSLIQKVLAVAHDKKIPMPQCDHSMHEKSDCDHLKNEIERIENVVPIDRADSLSHIVNSAWNAIDNPNLWKNKVHITQRDRTLQDLILKSIEVFEIEQKKKQQSTSVGSRL